MSENGVMVQSAASQTAILSEQQSARALLLYDGLCGFCNGTVQWLLKHDQFDRFRFAPQQSTFAEAVLRRHGIDREAAIAGNSAYLVLDLDSPGERLLSQSDVAVNALSILGGGWRVFGRLLRAVPRFLRNAAYTVLARNRFRLSSRYEVCPLPSAAERVKFLS
jgi:predicted DCC family thiol-disulfide oxidoreductase YuxK